MKSATPSKAIHLLKISLILGLVSLPLGWMGWGAWRSSRLSTNERSADRMITLLCSLEAEVRANDLDGNGVQDFWTGDVAGLLALIPANLRASWKLTPETVAALSQADPSRPGAKPYLGYWFTAILADENGKPYRRNGGNFHPSAFGWCAYPANYGFSGHGTYIINETHSPFKCYDNASPVPKWPAEEQLKSGWAKYGG